MIEEQKLENYYKTHRKVKPFHLEDHSVSWAFATADIKELRALQKQAKNIEFCTNKQVEQTTVDQLGVLGLTDVKAYRNICYSGTLSDLKPKHNIMWAGFKPASKLPMTRTAIVRYLRHCKKAKMLPEYLSVPQAVLADGTISAFLDITKDSKYDSNPLIYLYLCVLRHPREDPYFVKLALYLMDKGYHPITAWLIGSACDKRGNGHNFVSITSGGYPKYTPPNRLTTAATRAKYAPSIHALVNFKIKEYQQLRGGSSTFRADSLLAVYAANQGIRPPKPYMTLDELESLVRQLEKGE